MEGSLVVEDEKASRLISLLEEKALMQTVRGQRSEVVFVPINTKMGFLSQQKTEPCMVNSHFLPDGPHRY